MTVPTSSVIICAYTDQRWSDLQRAIMAVQTQTMLPDEIVVVIDHNPTLRQQVQDRFPQITTLENSGTRGLSGARNSGIARASGDVIAFLDDDAIAAPGWLARLLEPYTDDRVLGVGGAIEPAWADARPRWFPGEFGWVVGCGYRGQPQDIAPVRNLIGTNMSFRRAVFATVGGFRDELGRVGMNTAGCEETELCIRIRQQWPEGFVLYEPQARVQHHVPASRTTWRYFRSRCYAEGQSKALMTGFVGSQDGLSSERDYTFRTLPRGVARGVIGGLLHRNPTGLQRAGAIVAGLALTTAGYGQGLLARSTTQQALTPPGPIGQI
jgi:GT2 family glycosyltransferase